MTRLEDDFSKLDNDLLLLNLAKPALRALVQAELYSMNQVLQYGAEALSQLHGIGPGAIQRLFHK